MSDNHPGFDLMLEAEEMRREVEVLDRRRRTADAKFERARTEVNGLDSRRTGLITRLDRTEEAIGMLIQRDQLRDEVIERWRADAKAAVDAKHPND